jgi:hypothetical protein
MSHENGEGGAKRGKRRQKTVHPVRARVSNGVVVREVENVPHGQPWASTLAEEEA